MKRLKKELNQITIERHQSEISLNTIVIERNKSEITLNKLAEKRLENEISLQEINLKLRLIEGGFVEHMDNEFQKHKKKVKEENVVNYHG